MLRSVAVCVLSVTLLAAIGSAASKEDAAPAAETPASTSAKQVVNATRPTQLAAATIAPLVPLPEHPSTARNVVEQLQLQHFVKRPLDDEVSSRTLDNYLDILDGQRAYFTAADIAEFAPYRSRLDDALRNGDVGPAFTIFNRYQQRVRERLEHQLNLVNAGLDKLNLNANDSIEVDRAESPWPKDAAELDQIWERRLKATILPMLLNKKTIAEVQDVLAKRFRNRIAQVDKTISEDAFQTFINAFTATYDPHTNYFSPRVSENFNITMSLQLEGIGAVLRTEDEYTTVVSLVKGGPAEMAGALKPADRIVSVGQGKHGPLTDVVGWRLDDVVEMIRGPKNSLVRLEIMNKDGDAGSRIIEIVRNTVQLEEQSAKRRLITTISQGVEKKIGIIQIPTFYSDFNAQSRGDADYKSTTRDVRKLIDELKAEGMDGLIIDLRDNGGGALPEANQLTGLFIESGPTVQVRGSNRRVEMGLDTDGEMAWDGPLAVIVNRMSASASEIFAGAIQDYQRGLIIGSQTFGKGTVQTLVPLSRGQLKMTQYKFYRVSGQSTQHQGVLPDIALPELYDTDVFGESALDDALPWDTINPAAHRRYFEIKPLISRLTQLHEGRVASDPDFRYLDEINEHNRIERERKSISLNLNARKQEKANDDAWRLALENRLRTAKSEPLIASLDDLDEAETLAGSVSGGPPPLASVTEDGAPANESAEATEEEVAENANDEEPDALLRESGNILADFISLAQESVDRTTASRASATN